MILTCWKRGYDFAIAGILRVSNPVARWEVAAPVSNAPDGCAKESYDKKFVAFGNLSSKNKMFRWLKDEWNTMNKCKLFKVLKLIQLGIESLRNALQLSLASPASLATKGPQPSASWSSSWLRASNPRPDVWMYHDESQCIVTNALNGLSWAYCDIWTRWNIYITTWYHVPIFSIWNV